MCLQQLFQHLDIHVLTVLLNITIGPSTDSNLVF